MAYDRTAILTGKIMKDHCHARNIAPLTVSIPIYEESPTLSSMRDTEITGKNEEASTRTMVGKDLPQSP
jgi:hypothetical protein